MNVSKVPRPAAIGNACDNYHRNPAYPVESNIYPAPNMPYLLRCQNPASRRIVLVNGGDPYAVKRCRACAAELRRQVKTGFPCEILSDEPMRGGQ
ncbi:MAG: hypothetical protein ACREIQ_06190 [Nitrospiria bacterium]